MRRTAAALSRTRAGRVLGLAAACVLAACGGERAPEVRIPTGAGGVGFLPLLIMKEHRLVEKHAKAAGVDGLTVRWIDLGGPAVMNDALLSGSVDFIAAGPPGFLTLWDRTRDSARVKGVAAIASLPMYLNTRSERLERLDDLRDGDKIAVTAIKVSIPALVMQMYARARYGASDAARFDKYTVTMTHPDGVIALLSGSGAINAHFTSPPFHQREIQDPRIHTVMTTDDVLGGSTTFTMLSTTARFREDDPLIYRAVLEALEEAGGLIRADPERAAELLIANDDGAGLSAAQLVDVLKDPHIEFTTTPENVLKYAEFMHDVGSIGRRPESWRELFFPELHGAAGS